MQDTKLISIGQLAERTGMTVSAIRFYADQELIPCVRANSGHRHFQRSVIRRVSFILISQQLGYGLTEIAQALASLPDHRTPNKSDWARLSKKFSKDIESKIQQLQNLKESLDGCIGCGCLSLRSCRLYNPSDSAYGFGAGPRYLMGNKFKSISPE